MGSVTYLVSNILQQSILHNVRFSSSYTPPKLRSQYFLRPLTWLATVLSCRAVCVCVCGIQAIFYSSATPT